MFKRLTVFLYGVICYVVFFATFLYAIGFIGNFGVPRTLDSAPVGNFIASLAIDLGLLGLFAIQHSVMARPVFKRWFTRVIPEPAERSTYVLASSVALIVMFALWQPLGGMVWSATDATLRGVIWGSFAFGWLLLLASTFFINHFDLFGLRQIWLQLMGKPYTTLAFGTPGPYRHVRHPIYVGWMMISWSTPTMTVSHLVFAITTTVYMLIAIQFEERDLVDHFGKTYSEYKERVPMILPFTRKKSAAGSAFIRR